VKKYFDILGLPETATFEEISKAFRRRTKVVHPDRFDQRTQRDEWEQANRMLQELNDAYSRLKKWHQDGAQSQTRQSKSASQDGGQHSQQGRREERKEAREEKAQESSGESSEPYDFYKTVIRGTQQFAAKEAPLEVKAFLKGLHRDKNVLKFYSVRTQLHFLGGIACLALFAYVSMLYYNGSFSSTDSSFFALVILASGCLGGYFLDKFLKFFLCPVRPYFYFTPVYFIHVDLSGMVEYCYLWEVRSINKHREEAGLPYLNIVLQSKLIVANIMPWFMLGDFKKRLKDIESVRYSVSEKPEWLYKNDILNKQNLETRSKPNWHYMLVDTSIALLLILLWSVVLPAGNDAISANALSKIEDHAARETEASSSANTDGQSNAGAPVFDKPEKPLPGNGNEFSYSKKRNIAPLRISVPDGNECYFVKVFDASTNKPMKAIFIHPGQTVETKVPLGEIRLKYAIGQRWYGRKYLFGPETVVSEADKTFIFELAGNNVSGYTVQLIKQQNGNLHTKQIDIGEF